MIERISTTSNVKNFQINNSKRNKKQDGYANNSNPSFNGKISDKLIKGVQHCEKNPMLNVAVIDLATAIVPRSIFESFTNLFAGFEALRRESSGLIINCLIPGFLALGAAKLCNRAIMGNKADLSTCWSGKDGINTVSDYYKDAPKTSAYADGMAKYNDPKKARVYATHYNILSSASGVDGNETKKFSEIAGLDRASVAEKLTNATFEKPKKLSFADRMANIRNKFSGNGSKKTVSLIDDAFKHVAKSTHITENVTFGEGKKTIVSDVKSVMNNSTKLLRGFVADGAETPEQIASIAKRAKKLVNTKSGIAMAIIIPLAASAQYINRWITTKTSGVKGAPIYNDFGKNEVKVEKTPEQIKKDKQDLLKQKFISIGSMVGVACLSMMKLPTLSTLKNIFQFKGQFPTMDQARAISTVTFGSRMAVADDKNELAEATDRDLITFSSMYFLGDYAAKGYATHLEKTQGVKLLNRPKPLKKDANIFKKMGNWIVNTHLKSTDELAADATHSYKDMKILRSKCQVANFGSSLLILGLIVPFYTRMKTAKNRAKELKAASNVSFTSNQQQAQSQQHVEEIAQQVQPKIQQQGQQQGQQQNLTKIGLSSNFKTFQAFKHDV